MNPSELFEEVKSFIDKQDFDGAKKFIEENKDQLGEYAEKAQSLLKDNDAVNNVIDSVKGLFGAK